ncbi:hypothetical protein I7I48_12178 [Histoplasma ohiense]|nr:hypothetical protein I7I48_12178 [Histoplasma ohiense (nom. inval.)]
MGDADAAIGEIFESEGEIPPGRMASLGYKPRRQRCDVPSDEAMDDEGDSEVEVSRNRPSRRPAARTPKKVVRQINDGSGSDSDSEVEVSRNRPSRRPAARTPKRVVRQINDWSGSDSESEVEVARNRPSRRPAAEASNSQTRQRRYGQRAKSRMLKDNAAQDEDPEIANLRLQLARMGQKMDELMGTVTTSSGRRGKRFLR